MENLLLKLFVNKFCASTRKVFTKDNPVTISGIIWNDNEGKRQQGF